MKSFISFALFFFILTYGLAGYSQDFIIDNAGDASDINPGDGVCSSSPLAVICSLRAAIEEANALAGPNIISFGLAAGTQITIDTELLIEVDGQTTIDGDIDGDKLPDITIVGGSGLINGLVITSNDNNILHLNIVNFINGRGAILIDGLAATGNKIAGSFLGTDISGNNPSATPNFYGLRVINGASGNFIGDAAEGFNVISGNTFGMLIENSNNNILTANYVGVNLGGTGTIGNGGYGVRINGSDGTVVGDLNNRNIIAGNNAIGLNINNSPNTLVINNYIGTNVDGDADFGNGDEGILIDNVSAGTNIGNGVAGGGNLISGNTRQGLRINSTGINVLGNTIGLNAAGNAAIPNSGFGIWLAIGATGVNIGDGTANGRNLVSGNSTHGIQLSDGPNTVLGNYIGLGADGNQLLGNTGIGLFLVIGADSDIGGNIAGQGNIICGNSAGIQVSEGKPKIFGNTIGLDASRTQVRANNEGIRLTGTATGVLVGDGTAAGAKFYFREYNRWNIY